MVKLCVKVKLAVKYMILLTDKQLEKVNLLHGYAQLKQI